MKLSRLEQTLQSQIADSKECFIYNLVSSFSSDQRKLYRYLRNLRRPAQSTLFVGLNSEVLRDPLEIACAFNLFFHSTFTTSDYVLPSKEKLPAALSQLSYISIDSSDTYQALSRLQQNKAMGCDNISPKILKACAASLSEPVSVLFSKCLDTCTFPVEWKTHKITPIPKSGDLSRILNYRPISLLCILSKVLESLVFENIIDFIRPKLSSAQFGFLSKRSSTTQLLACYAKIVDAFENRMTTDVVYLDLKKAFDSVPHQELLFKLWRMGVTGRLWSWFEAYLSNRTHFVHYKGSSSPSLPVISGVPQGSVLGPLLFLVYINDIPTSISFSFAFLFADDAKVLKSLLSNFETTCVQKDLDSICNWSDVWKIRLNALKCAYIHFAMKGGSSTAQYQVNESDVCCTSSYRDLGITITDSLSWSTHIGQICSKAYRSFHIIKRNIPLHCSTGLRKRLYLVLVRSHLSYGSQLWRPHLVKDIKNLERVQRRATRFILQDNSTDYKSRLISLSLLPVNMWIELQDVLFIVKCLQDPPDNFNVLEYISFTRNNTRSSTKKRMEYKYKRTTIGRHYYFNRIVRLWNALPDLDLQRPIGIIKNKLTVFLWNHFNSNFNPDNPCTYHLRCPCSNCHLSHT